MVGEETVDGKNELYPFFIALAIFIGFVVFIIMFIPGGDADTINVILTAFIAWIGAIIGFYFGQKPVRGLTEDVKTLTSDNTTVKRKKKEVVAFMAELSTKYINYVSKQAQLKGESPELLEMKELINKIDEKVKEEILE